MAKYGFTALNQNTSVGSKNTQVNPTSWNSFKLGRVVEVSLDPLKPTELGYVKYVDVTATPKDILSYEENKIYPTAKPLYPNVTNAPLINEVVLLITQPDAGVTQNLNSISTYYVSVISLWNHPHHNALPQQQGTIAPSQNKTYLQTILGSTVKNQNQSTEITFGRTFREKANIHPLLPFEGDIIYQGRWGNSIRFGSTVTGSLNTWSSTGNDGDPITIFRNGQPISASDLGYESIVENINEDLSSIWMTSTQQLPISASNYNYFSYPSGSAPVDPNLYAGNQIVINSGRLLFNSTSDHILFSSAKSINLGAVETVNIDSPTFTIQSEKILLGSKNARQSVLLGDRTVDTLNALINNLTGFLQVCSTLVATPAGTPLVPLNAAANNLSTELLKIQGNLEKLKSEYVKTI